MRGRTAGGRRPARRQWGAWRRGPCRRPGWAPERSTGASTAADPTGVTVPFARSGVPAGSPAGRARDRGGRRRLLSGPVRVRPSGGRDLRPVRGGRVRRAVAAAGLGAGTGARRPVRPRARRGADRPRHRAGRGHRAGRRRDAGRRLRADLRLGLRTQGRGGGPRAPALLHPGLLPAVRPRDPPATPGRPGRRRAAAGRGRVPALARAHRTALRRPRGPRAARCGGHGEGPGAGARRRPTGRLPSRSRALHAAAQGLRFSRQPPGTSPTGAGRTHRALAQTGGAARRLLEQLAALAARPAPPPDDAPTRRLLDGIADCCAEEAEAVRGGRPARGPGGCWR